MDNNSNNNVPSPSALDRNLRIVRREVLAAELKLMLPTRLNLSGDWELDWDRMTEEEKGIARRLRDF